MLKKDLAEALGLSASMVSRLAREGMPVDSIAAARRWRDSHLQTARRKEHRFPSIGKPRPPAVRAADDASERAAGQVREALAHVEALGRAGARLLAEGSSMAALEPELRQALRQVPISARDRIRLAGTPDEFGRFLGKPAPEWPADAPADAVQFPLPVWELLVAEALAVVRETEAEMIAAGELLPADQRPALSDDDAALMGDFWYCAAAGEVRGAL